MKCRTFLGIALAIVLVSPLLLIAMLAECVLMGANGP